jgi:hypothetical protein
MTTAERSIRTVASALSGTILGVALGFYAPVSVALLLSQHPFHSGNYGGWILGLMAALAVAGGLVLGALAWGDRWPRGLRVARWMALLFACWQLYLVMT